MTRIDRQPVAFADNTYDLILVGGGIYGATLLYEASRRGLRALLIEKDDFGSGVSGNSLRIVHGGLRYLQNMELGRHRESTNERRWHLQQFPDLVAPLKCMMPLYGKGLKRPSTFRVALKLNDLLSYDRNKNVRKDRHLPGGRVANASEVRDAFPLVNQQNLKGAGVWYDAVMISSERVVMELLRHAVANGGRALNYVKATGLVADSGKAAGVQAIDTETGLAHVYRAKQVINCAGPWCRDVAAAFDQDVPVLYRKSLAFNLLFDRPAISEYAVAVEPPVPDPSAYFIVPWKGMMHAGTRHMLWDGDPDDQRPPESEIEEFIEELNMAVPGLDAKRSEVRRVYAGMLPAMKAGSPDMAHEPVLTDHATLGGPKDLISVSGVKWTTARDVAEQTLKLALGTLPAIATQSADYEPYEPATLSQMHERGCEPDLLDSLCGQLFKDESVVHLDDLLLRRMDGLDTDTSMVNAVAAGLNLFDTEDRAAQLERLLAALDRRRDYSAQAVREAGLLSEGAAA